MGGGGGFSLPTVVFIPGVVLEALAEFKELPNANAPRSRYFKLQRMVSPEGGNFSR